MKKYIAPTLKLVVLEVKDVVAMSLQFGSITVDNFTIEGPKDEFSVDFGTLFGQ